MKNFRNKVYLSDPSKTLKPKNLFPRLQNAQRIVCAMRFEVTCFTIGLKAFILINCDVLVNLNRFFNQTTSMGSRRSVVFFWNNLLWTFRTFENVSFTKYLKSYSLFFTDSFCSFCNFDCVLSVSIFVSFWFFFTRHSSGRRLGGTIYGRS